MGEVPGSIPGQAPMLLVTLPASDFAPTRQETSMRRESNNRGGNSERPSCDRVLGTAARMLPRPPAPPLRHAPRHNALHGSGTAL
jgi:hypothetical protein